MIRRVQLSIAGITRPVRIYDTIMAQFRFYESKQRVLFLQKIW